MKKGSPGGILLIALGVILLNLGWTGRFAAVFEALKNGASSATTTGETPEHIGPLPNPGPQNPVTPNNTGAAAIQRPVYVTVAGSNGASRKVVDEQHVLKSNNGTCSNGQFAKVTIDEKKDNVIYCVDPTKLFDRLPIGGGEADMAYYGYMLQPTGRMALRYVPNAIRNA